MKNKNSKKRNWLIDHVLSPLYFDFSYDFRDFWFEKEKLLDKNQKIKFRYFKIWFANILAWIFFLPLPIILGLIFVIYKNPTFYGYLGFLFSSFFGFFIAACLSTFSSIYMYIKKPYDD